MTKLKSIKRTRILDDSQPPFRCIICGKSFRTQDELSEHQYYNCTGGW